MVSVNRLLKRKAPFPVQDWILDSGAFTRLIKGQGHLSVDQYADEIIRWNGNGNLVAAVAQDYLCDPAILAATRLTIADHQRLTIERYDALIDARIAPAPYIMPVLQGYEPQDYVEHLKQYGDRLAHGAWVGVGSICGRSGNPGQIEAVLMAIHSKRPDLRLHGFGIKKVALSSPIVWDILYSADSLAHSASARRRGENQNDPVIAINYFRQLARPNQLSIFANG